MTLKIKEFQEQHSKAINSPTEFNNTIKSIQQEIYNIISFHCGPDFKVQLRNIGFNPDEDIQISIQTRPEATEYIFSLSESGRQKLFYIFLYSKLQQTFLERSDIYQINAALQAIEKYNSYITQFLKDTSIIPENLIINLEKKDISLENMKFIQHFELWADEIIDQIWAEKFKTLEVHLSKVKQALEQTWSLILDDEEMYSSLQELQNYSIQDFIKKIEDLKEDSLLIWDITSAKWGINQDIFNSILWSITEDNLEYLQEQEEIKENKRVEQEIRKQKEIEQNRLEQEEAQEKQEKKKKLKGQIYNIILALSILWWVWIIGGSMIHEYQKKKERSALMLKNSIKSKLKWSVSQLVQKSVQKGQQSIEQIEWYTRLRLENTANMQLKKLQWEYTIESYKLSHNDNNLIYASFTLAGDTTYDIQINTDRYIDEYNEKALNIEYIIKGITDKISAHAVSLQQFIELLQLDLKDILWDSWNIQISPESEDSLVVQIENSVTWEKYIEGIWVELAKEKNILKRWVDFFYHNDSIIRDSFVNIEALQKQLSFDLKSYLDSTTKEPVSLSFKEAWKNILNIYVNWGQYSYTLDANEDITRNINATINWSIMRTIENNTPLIEDSSIDILLESIKNKIESKWILNPEISIIDNTETSKHIRITISWVRYTKTIKRENSWVWKLDWKHDSYNHPIYTTY